MIKTSIIGEGDSAIHLRLESDGRHRFLTLSADAGADSEPGEISVELDDVEALARELLALKTLADAS
jgi:hypothetical protein